MGLRVIFLVVGVGLAPLRAAVTDHLGVLGTGFDFPAAIVWSALTLTVGTTANELAGTKTAGGDHA